MQGKIADDVLNGFHALTGRGFTAKFYGKSKATCCHVLKETKGKI